ncbi:hypothetical protein niasHS_010195 [Heterodera schachtii]|uniref:Transmembrane protein n=1 Tax=Heterodera schachtii TaxID=97005 RepID=A0ABD2J0S6_HETSC
MEHQQKQPKEMPSPSGASAAAPPLPKLSVHSGNGKLRGGGVRAVREQSTLQRLFSRLERRLGLAMALCMATILCALAINGLFHDRVRATMVQLIGTIEQEVRVLQHHEIVLFTDTFWTASFTGSDVSEEDEIQTQQNATSDAKESNGQREQREGENEGEKGEEEANVKTNGSSNNNLLEMARYLRMRADQLTELDEFRQRFDDTDNAIWALVFLDLLGLVLLVPILCHFCCRASAAKTVSRSCCFAFRVLLVLLVLLCLLQLFLLLSLLDNALKFPSIVDKLFNFYLDEVPTEKRAEIIGPAEDQFSCKIKVEHELLERYGLQEQCLPKMKGCLLSPSIVVFLILITLFPFILTIITCFWPKHLNILAPLERAHRKVQLFQTEGRTQNRNQILKNALGRTKRDGEKEEEPKMYY